MATELLIKATKSTRQSRQYLGPSQVLYHIPNTTKDPPDALPNTPASGVTKTATGKVVSMS